MLAFAMIKIPYCSGMQDAEANWPSDSPVRMEVPSGFA
jgi:hypothetical protein